MNPSVQNWLDELNAAPSRAIQKLVLGYAGVTAWSRSSLRESFIEIFPAHAEALEVAVADWLRERLMKLPPEETPTIVWAAHLQDLFGGLAGLPLPRVARLLRDRLRDFRSWLRPLRTESGPDPEAAYLAALAWAETNQHLEGMWQGLALRRNREPAHYIDIGLLGLRKTRDERGQLPTKAPFLLLATLIDLADTGIAQKEWLLTARALLGGYHCSLETWAREFEPVISARRDAKHGPGWLRKVLPPLRSERPDSPVIEVGLPTADLTEAKRIIHRVAQRGPAAIQGELGAVLSGYRTYARAAGDATPLVRMFNQLADAARTHDPDWAVARAEEAMEWDPNHEFCWTALARALWARGLKAERAGNEASAEADCREAMDLLWRARFRFPSNAHVRTELAKMLGASGDAATAETVYREAQSEFPQNPWGYTGLADMLLRLDTETGTQAHSGEARALLQRAADLGNAYAKRRLRSIAQQAPSTSTVAALFESAEEEVLGPVVLPAQHVAEMRPAQRLGRALLFHWQARHASSGEEREGLLAQAEDLLNLPDELTGECRSAFVEARGFLLLARNRTEEARTYFEQQLVTAAPRRPLGLRLGLAESRIRLGEKLSDAEESELASFGPEGSILPLVLKVVRLLESTASDDALRDLLLELYPRVCTLAGMPPSELGDDEEGAAQADPVRRRETPDAMMARLLLANAFGPATLDSLDDLNSATTIHRVRDSLRPHRDDILAVFEKLALAA
ncbi:MAG: hypothetical protein H7A45_11320 [Verrucomicrobiales bacterium]|nr:hypothetical protein [Verrucomicrobiales bacterium]MCP5526046.1 hypothetical protein [Verrucomicrobiales bacterium]